MILWSLVAYKLPGPSAQPLRRCEPGESNCCPSLDVGSRESTAAAAVASSSGTMGASLSQDTAYLPDEVINNYRRSDDRDLRPISSGEPPALLQALRPRNLLTEEFVEVFSPSLWTLGCTSGTREKERGRVSSFEALAGCYLTSRNWDESSEKLLVTALFQVFDRSSKGSLSRVEMEILLRTSCQALTSLYRTKPVADYVLRDAVKKIFGDKKNGSGPKWRAS